MKNFSQVIGAVIILVLGILIGSILKGCEGKQKPLILQRTDTVVIDTSKIIYKTPIVINQVQAPVVDYYHDCWNSFPITVNEHGDTLSIDSVNSCKGIFKGVHQNYKPDTVCIPIAKIIRDTVRESYKIPSFAEGSLLDFNVSAKAGIGYNVLFGTGLDLNLSYGRIGVNVAPSLYYLDKFRGFIFVGLTYKILQ